VFSYKLTIYLDVFLMTSSWLLRIPICSSRSNAYTNSFSVLQIWKSVYTQCLRFFITHVTSSHA